MFMCVAPSVFGRANRTVPEDSAPACDEDSPQSHEEHKDHEEE
jgi:hypothetical protein